MGELWPSPASVRHNTFGSPFHGLMISDDVPSRFGPSHCGQSPPLTDEARAKLAQANKNQRMRMSPDSKCLARCHWQRDSINCLAGGRYLARGRFIQEYMQRGVAPLQAIFFRE